MSKRLGIGEFERVNVEVKQSTSVARHKFLKILAEREGNCFLDLMRLFNYNLVPQGYLDKEQIDSTIYLFLRYLLCKETYEVEIPTNIIDTPLINYYSFLFHYEDQIKELENDENFQHLTLLNSSERRNKAIGKIVGNWKALKSLDGAEAFCRSLEIWAKNYNLYEEWFLDFSLKVLSRFKSEFDIEVSNLKRMPLSNINWFNTAYRMKSRDSIHKGIYDYWFDEIYSKQCPEFDDSGELPAFEYRWHNFEISSDTWLVGLISRKEFVALINKNLKKTIKNIRYVKTIFHQSTTAELKDLFENMRNLLESYCDKIEKQKSKNLNDLIFEPKSFGQIEQFIWNPSKQDREQFIEIAYQKLKTKIKKNNKAVKSLESFTKSDFDTKLTKYCNDIEISSQSEWVRMPKKYSGDKHFRWFVDYQLSNDKTFTELAKENGVHLQSFKEGVQKIANIIGITLRKPKRTGKPKGTKNSKTLNPQLGIYQK